MVRSLQSPPAVGAVVLAAGGSSRMGQPKQLLPVGGRPMVRLVAEVVCAAGLAQVVVVIGAEASAVAQALAGLPVEIVVNPHWADGLSTSVRAGLGVLRPEVQAALMVLADQPRLTPGLLTTLADCHRNSGAPIVVPVHEGRRGNPALFDRALFSELMALEGDQGGRTLIERYEARVEFVQVDEAAIVMDVDTREDYERAQVTGQPT